MQGFQGYCNSLDALWLLSARVFNDCYSFGCYLQGFQMIAIALDATCNGAEIHTERHTEIHTERHTETHTEIHTERHTEIHTEIRAEIHTERHTEIHAEE